MNQTELLMSGRQVVIGGLGVSRSVYDLALVITRGLGSVFTLTVGTVKMMCILSKGVFYILSATGKWVKFRMKKSLKPPPLRNVPKKIAVLRAAINFRAFHNYSENHIRKLI